MSEFIKDLPPEVCDLIDAHIKRREELIAEIEMRDAIIAQLNMSDAESIAMYRRSRDRADRLQREVSELREKIQRLQNEVSDYRWRDSQ